MLPRRARSLVTALIAHGREAGTPAAAAARGAVSRFLSELGYTVQEQPFSFNGGIYRVMPVAGALLVIVSLVEIPLLIRPGPAWGAAGALLVLTVASSLMTFHFLAGDGAPRSARTDANLIAQRQGAVVRCWLVAHLDTKAQGHSMAGRLVALWVTLTALAGLLVMAGLRMGAPQPAAAADGSRGSGRSCGPAADGRAAHWPVARGARQWLGPPRGADGGRADHRPRHRDHHYRRPRNSGWPAPGRWPGSVRRSSDRQRS